MQVQDREMTKGVQAVDTATKEIRRLTERLDADGQTLISAWRGDAQRAFNDLWARWQEEQRKLFLALQEMHDALAQVQQSNRSQEEVNVNRYRHLQGQF